MTYEIPKPVLKLADELQTEMDSIGPRHPKQESLMIQFNNMGAAQLHKAVLEYRKSKESDNE